MRSSFGAFLTPAGLITIGLGCGLCAVSAPAYAQQPAQAIKTVWDGAYTEAQATRGEAVYAAECRSCHGADLSGEQSRLAGNRFMTDWREDNLDSLFRRTRSVMPRRTPGSLTDAQYFDVVAYVLQQNGFPAGSTDLSADVSAGILLVGKEGPQPVPEFALIQVPGCLKEVSGGWMLTNAPDPRRTRTPDVTADDLQSAGAKMSGTGSFRLLEAFAYKPGPQKDHQVMVKGLLIKRPDNRINVTALETVAATCEP